MTQVSGWVDVVEVGLYSTFLYEVSCIILWDYKQFDIRLCVTGELNLIGRFKFP